MKDSFPWDLPERLELSDYEPPLKREGDGPIVPSGAEEFWLHPESYHSGLRNISDHDLRLHVADQARCQLAPKEKRRYPTDVALRICARVLELCLPNASDDERVTIYRLQHSIKMLRRRAKHRPSSAWYQLAERQYAVEWVRELKEKLMREGMKYHDALAQAYDETAPEFGRASKTLKDWIDYPGRRYRRSK